MFAQYSLTIFRHSFYNRAVRKVEHVSRSFKKMEGAFAECCKLFAENPKTTEPSQLFSAFGDFVANWKVNLSGSLNVWSSVYGGIFSCRIIVVVLQFFTQ